MKTLLCDSEAFEPFRQLVEGPLEADSLPRVERFVRAIVLHDGASLMPIAKCTGPEGNVLKYSVITPQIETYGLLALNPAWSFEMPWPGVAGPSQSTPNTMPYDRSLQEKFKAWDGKLDSALELFADAYTAGLRAGYLDRGGSILTKEASMKDFGPRKSGPETLFSELDTKWQQYALDTAKNGLGLLVPSVLGIVLTRCAHRAAIPSVLNDLKNEWSDARRKVWKLLDALRVCSTLCEAIEIKNEIAEASRMFSPEVGEFDTRPVRVFWDITAGIAAGAAIGVLSGGQPLIGALTGGIGQLARSTPSLCRDFGPALFGRGAFDLARRVKRGVSSIELDVLGRLISNSEKQGLGIK